MPTSFKALFAGWSMIVVVLSVAGYSFRWNYYYNFGLQSLVLAAPLESLPVYAIEIARNPKFVVDLLVLALLYLLPFHVALLLIERARRARDGRVRNATQVIVHALGLDNRLLVETVVAAIVILIAFRAGGEAGYRTYINNAAESTSVLPKVTAIARPGAKESPLPIDCDTRTFKGAEDLKTPPFIGDPDVVGSLAAGLACSTTSWSWRLLLRDEKFTYLFATVQDPAHRPHTVVLPTSADVTLVFR